ncbi:hypothetical protein TRVA0_031S00848 [Trichomonascus vanleenenianus]|uniref:uncharacterized protein n=1 Tax=Trichomonascus vanleenenianus TaxID=2268995 RepID=UPI003ECB98F4
MGKGTDKLYVTAGEREAQSRVRSGEGEVRNPFWYCSISLQPIEGKSSGVCDRQGHVFDISNIVPELRKNGGKNPVTGEDLKREDLIKLRLTQNDQGNYVDPVSLVEMTVYNTAVCVLTTGYVYLKSTIEEHNYKAKWMYDLMTDEEFTKSDVVELKGGYGVRYSKHKKTGEPAKSLKRSSPDESEVSGQLKKSKVDEKKAKLQEMSSATTHHMAASLTSTVFTPSTKIQLQKRSVLQMLKPKRFKDPAFVNIETNKGTLRLVLDPTYAPKAVYNFVQLAKQGYYDGVKFHRSIKRFMIQGGDPTGTGRGGESVYGEPFADETNHPRNKHDARGVLSMANRGKNTNTSQFFITYRPCPHLDGKHTVFGKLVGGESVLDELERTPVDEGDRPVEDLVMKKVTVVEDPFEEANEEEKEKEEEVDDTPWLKKSGSKTSVGQYLKFPVHSSNSGAKQTKKTQLTSIEDTDFSGW